MDETKTGNFLLRGDDGALYRIDKSALAGYKLPATDPAYKSAPTFDQATGYGKPRLNEFCIIPTFVVPE